MLPAFLLPGLSGDPGPVSGLLVLLAPVVFLVGAAPAGTGDGPGERREAARDEPGPPPRGQLP